MVFIYNKNVKARQQRKVKQMTTSQKLRRAKELVAQEQDGSTYLQSVCTLKELDDLFTKTRSRDVKDIIQDAITLRKHFNEMKRRKYSVSL